VSATRDDIVLPDAIWREVDRNVHGLLASWPTLHAAGLSANRGVLLAGPPGTGKTALCRVIATEVAGNATVVFADASSVSHAIGYLYAELRHLAPAVVVLEDVDLVVSHRYHGGGSTLIDFLLALDGAMSTHAGVVTIATTNDVAAIDPAARRASRFDAVIDVPAPDLAGRAAIIERYLAGVEHDEIDVRAVAAACAGCTGADLRELVSEAVLHVLADRRGTEGGTIDHALLLRLARRSRGRSVALSHYL
jgi:SpoVK/Ycf46/Vps4 family AAA+-type ATPase